MPNRKVLNVKVGQRQPRVGEVVTIQNGDSTIAIKFASDNKHSTVIVSDLSSNIVNELLQKRAKRLRNRQSRVDSVDMNRIQGALLETFSKK